MKKRVGILGGMGPQATIDFANKIITHTQAQIDQEHIEMIIHNDPTIPSRIDSINGTGENILPRLIKNAQDLVDFGADFLVLPCNTAHYYYDEISKQIQIPFLSIIDETVDYLYTSGFNKIGIVGTRPTIELALYQKKWRNLGKNCIEHPLWLQETTERMIASVKANDFNHASLKELENFINFFQRSNIDALVLACTELPLYFAKHNVPLKLIDPTLILALKTITYAGYTTR